MMLGYSIAVSLIAFAMVSSDSDKSPIPSKPAAWRSDPRAPKPRPRDEVLAKLRIPDKPADQPLTLLLVAGRKDHGPNEHDYPDWLDRWGRLLAKADQVEVLRAMEWPEPEQWEKADGVLFFFWNKNWSPERLADLDRFFERGGGAVFLHSAVISRNETELLARRLGLAYSPGSGKVRHGALTLTFKAGHPITEGFESLDFVDESYWNYTGDMAAIDTLATTVEEGKPRPMLWTHSMGKGKAVGCILGHYRWTFDDPYARLLIFRSLLWSIGQPTNRLDGIVLEGDAAVEP